LPHFDNTAPYTWPIASGSGVTNFAASKFLVKNALFADDLAGGYFLVALNGGRWCSRLPTTIRPPPLRDLLLRPWTRVANPLAALAPKWSDPDGDPVTFLSAYPSSANGLNNVAANAAFLITPNTAALRIPSPTPSPTSARITRYLSPGRYCPCRDGLIQNPATPVVQRCRCVWRQSHTLRLRTARPVEPTTFS